MPGLMPNRELSLDKNLASLDNYVIKDAQARSLDARR